MRTQLLLVFWTSLYCQVYAVFRRTTGEGSKVMEGEKESAGQALRRSKRGWMWNHFFLMEEYTGEDRQYVGKLQSDLDKGDGSVKYVLSGEGAGSIFVIDENSGDLHATKRLDREEKAFYRLHIKAVNKITNRPLEPETDFIIKIHDINDNEPKFSKELYEASVHEMSDIGTSVIQVTATDADDSTYGNSAKLTYSILHGQPYFSVEPETGIIRTALPSMDREKREHYQVVIQAKDMAGQNGGLSGTATVNISLLDVNDNPPQFPQRIYQFSIPESSEPGALVGRIKAIDADVGRNAEMKYSIVAGDGLDVFEMVTDQNTQEGIVTGRKALDYEKKKTYTLAVKVEDAHPDPRFLSATSFKDAATVRVVVEDVDEPPVFERPSYIMEVKEESAAGTAVGSVSAADPDQRHSPVRYSIDRLTDLDMNFNIHPGNGSIFAVRPLDREAAAWHNITVIAVESDNLRQMSRVPVHIRVLDINDNAPTFATFYEAFVCENAKAGQRIQTVSATDSDDPAGGHRFSFRLAPEGLTKGNFTIRDNGDNTAGIILTRSSGFSRQQKSSYLVPVVISDGDYPVQSSTSTLTVRVCACGRDGSMELCNAEALTHAAGLSTGALVAILLCIVILLMIVVLFAALRRQKKKEPLIISKEDVRDNIISYNDEGGGEEDTQAFDIGALRHPEAVEENAKRRDILPEALGPPPRQSAALFRDNADVRHFINQRVQESDQNPAAPPYDSLATYAYEGTGSVAESLSSLGSASSDQDQDYNYLSEWGPRFRKLADMYGDEDRYS